MLSTVTEIIRDLLIFVGVIAVLLVALVVVVSKLPDTNPLKRLLTALCYRLGATLAAGAIALPLEPIPGIDLAYDRSDCLRLVLVHVFQGCSPHYVQPASPEPSYWSAIQLNGSDDNISQIGNARVCSGLGGKTNRALQRKRLRRP
jgi:hypothetical protein